jgi:multicomponent K+:H+ antiporter subunit A
MKSPQLSMALIVLKWPVACVSLWLMIRGLDLIGGGFAGGLLMSLYSVLAASNLGHRINVSLLSVSGLMLALASGLCAWALSGEFMKTASFWGPLSTALMFEIGVGLAVWGSVTAIAYAAIEGEQ